jgi:hypothetical protein
VESGAWPDHTGRAVAAAKSLHTETCSEMTPGSIRNVWLHFLVKEILDRFLCNSRSPAAQHLLLPMKLIASLTFKEI